MGKLIIVLGDTTDHGGTVITAGSTTDTMGLPWARMGDMVSCPKCKGVFPIAQGDMNFISDGAAVAYDGCKVACGATLIGGKQGITTTVPHGGAAPGAGGGLEDRFGVISSTMVAAYEDEPVDSDGQRFKGRFQVLDRNSGQPVAPTNVRVRSTEGQYITGQTDSEGYTQWVERDASEALAFDLVEPDA
ncbi:PAAR domain-containing protein [Massilia glaciei]|uniref:PAAR domain-containing protein n=1 Tax=Massilia glaciei TaxID=1524097 RepID=A0A2U2HC68_9BURK|nr:PAAR domain-containing protein [Massilia glaciei]PWF40544.1 PAAR domain-containing protein [Massilia glaciei]